MNVFEPMDLQELSSFSGRKEQMAVLKRQKPIEAETFFKKLMRTPFSIAANVMGEDAGADIKDILEDEVPEELQNDPFYNVWIADMAAVCRSFCDMQKTNAVGFCLGSQRGCRRYHIDNVPLRLLVTYAGQGTEWLPDEAADRLAFLNGAPNEKIIKNPSAIQFMSSWDVSVFRGGPQGLLHRTPDSALNGPSILMRLDHPSFWNNVLNHGQQKATVAA